MAGTQTKAFDKKRYLIIDNNSGSYETFVIGWYFLVTYRAEIRYSYGVEHYLGPYL